MGSKKYEILLICLFLLFFIFLASECLLFISFFWASFHSLSSLTLGISLGEGFYFSDPFELTFANTLLLSNAAVCLGGAFISLELSQATFVFLFLFLHLVRAVFYGSYFYYQKTWFSGILLFLLLMAIAFMGYVLPFGQMSFWGATVITNLLSPFPSLVEW